MTEESTRGEPQLLKMTVDEGQKLVNLANEMPTKFGLPILQILQGIQQRAQVIPQADPPPAPAKANGTKRAQA